MIEDRLVEYPFRSLADVLGPSPDLVSTPVIPQRVVLSRHVQHPEGALGEAQPALFHATTSPAHLVLDFGQEVVGYLDVVASAKRETCMTVTYGESLEEALQREIATGADWYQTPQDVLRLSTEPRTVRHAGRRAFRYVHLWVDDPGVSVALHAVRATLVHYPVEDRGFFSCADTRLNEIWDLCRTTTKLCMQRFYEDGVKRDGLLWISDYRVQFLSNWAPFGDAELARRALITIAASQRADGALPACAAIGGGHQHPEVIGYMPGVPEEVCAHWVVVNYCVDYLSAVRDYVMHTGDLETLRDLWPTLLRLLSYLEQYDFHYDPTRNDWLSDAHYWISQGGTLLQAVLGFDDGAELARIMQAREVCARCQALASQLRQRVRAEYCDGTRGLFTDSPSTDPTPLSSWHVNCYAVLVQLVHGAECDALLRRTAEVSRHEPETGYAQLFKLAGLFQAGLTDWALEGMRGYWGFMLDRGATTAWEHVNIPAEGLGAWANPITSRCHGWGGGACYLLPRYVLGVSPLSPGYATVSIEPHLGSLAWAEGTIPTPHGPIRVAFDAGGGIIALPAGITGTCALAGTTHPLQSGENRIPGHA